MNVLGETAPGWVEKGLRSLLSATQYRDGDLSVHAYIHVDK